MPRYTPIAALGCCVALGNDASGSPELHDELDKYVHALRHHPGLVTVANKKAWLLSQVACLQNSRTDVNSDDDVLRVAIKLARQLANLPHDRVTFGQSRNVGHGTKKAIAGEAFANVRQIGDTDGKRTSVFRADSMRNGIDAMFVPIGFRVRVRWDSTGSHKWERWEWFDGPTLRWLRDPTGRDRQGDCGGHLYSVRPKTIAGTRNVYTAAKYAWVHDERSQQIKSLQDSALEAELLEIEAEVAERQAGTTKKIGTVYDDEGLLKAKASLHEDRLRQLIQEMERERQTAVEQGRTDVAVQLEQALAQREAQRQYMSEASGMPGWVMPVAIAGGGTVLLTTLAIALTR